MTLRPLIPETVEMISSVMPSAKYSSLGSGLKLAKGRTAILFLSSVGCVVENAGGTKVFDRARSVGCKDPHYLKAHFTEISELVGIEPFANHDGQRKCSDSDVVRVEIDSKARCGRWS
jgi:hypothetical protein